MNLPAFDGRVELDELTHIYTVDDHLRYEWSVSRVIHSFFPPFDADATLAALAPTMSAVQLNALRASWTTKAATCDDAQVKGRALHASIERYVKTGAVPPVDDDDVIAFGQFLAYERAMRDRGWHIVRSEVCLADTDYAIGGCVDALLVPIGATDWSRTIVADWKRNEQIKADSRIASRGFAPLEHYPCAKGSLYTLQLNTYAAILEKYEPTMHVEEAHIVAFHPARRHYQQVSVPLMPNDVWRMLEMHRARQVGSETW